MIEMAKSILGKVRADQEGYEKDSLLYNLARIEIGELERFISDTTQVQHLDGAYDAYQLRMMAESP